MDQEACRPQYHAAARRRQHASDAGHAPTRRALLAPEDTVRTMTEGVLWRLQRTTGLGRVVRWWTR